MRLRPWLWLPSEWAHNLSPTLLPLIASCFGNKLSRPAWRSFTWRSLHFASPLGLAGGVDKTGQSLECWQNLGAGFVEIGTVTPNPQTANPGRIMRRDSTREIVWNKMGFPSPGMIQVAQTLKTWKERKIPLFINIGKNRETPLEQATTDYVKCLLALSPLADAIVVNISSPNTEGLRSLQSEAYLKQFLTPIAHASRSLPKPLPLLLKLSPDLDDLGLETALEVSLGLDFSGWILTNTTLARTDQRFPPDGGISGKPLAQLSKAALRKTLITLGSARQGRLLISSGGVLSAEDVFERLEMGADLVQVYSALIFQGPLFFQAVAKQAALDLKS